MFKSLRDASGCSDELLKSIAKWQSVKEDEIELCGNTSLTAEAVENFFKNPPKEFYQNGQLDFAGWLRANGYIISAYNKVIEEWVIKNAPYNCHSISNYLLYYGERTPDNTALLSQGVVYAGEMLLEENGVSFENNKGFYVKNSNFSEAFFLNVRVPDGFTGEACDFSNTVLSEFGIEKLFKLIEKTKVDGANFNTTSIMDVGLLAMWDCQGNIVTITTNAKAVDFSGCRGMGDNPMTIMLTSTKIYENTNVKINGGYVELFSNTAYIVNGVCQMPVQFSGDARVSIGLNTGENAGSFEPVEGKNPCATRNLFEDGFCGNTGGQPAETDDQANQLYDELDQECDSSAHVSCDIQQTNRLAVPFSDVPVIFTHENTTSPSPTPSLTPSSSPTPSPSSSPSPTPSPSSSPSPTPSPSSSPSPTPSPSSSPSPTPSPSSSPSPTPSPSSSPSPTQSPSSSPSPTPSPISSPSPTPSPISSPSPTPSPSSSPTPSPSSSPSPTPSPSSSPSPTPSPISSPSPTPSPSSSPTPSPSSSSSPSPTPSPSSNPSSTPSPSSNSSPTPSPSSSPSPSPTPSPIQNQNSNEELLIILGVFLGVGAIFFLAFCLYRFFYADTEEEEAALLLKVKEEESENEESEDGDQDPILNTSQNMINAMGNSDSDSSSEFENSEDESSEGEKGKDPINRSDERKKNREKQKKEEQNRRERNRRERLALGKTIEEVNDERKKEKAEGKGRFFKNIPNNVGDIFFTTKRQAEQHGQKNSRQWLGSSEFFGFFNPFGQRFEGKVKGYRDQDEKLICDTDDRNSEHSATQGQRSQFVLDEESETVPKNDKILFLQKRFERWFSHVQRAFQVIPTKSTELEMRPIKGSESGGGIYFNSKQRKFMQRYHLRKMEELVQKDDFGFPYAKEGDIFVEEESGRFIFFDFKQETDEGLQKPIFKGIITDNEIDLSNLWGENQYSIEMQIIAHILNDKKPIQVRERRFKNNLANALLKFDKQEHKIDENLIFPYEKAICELYGKINFRSGQLTQEEKEKKEMLKAKLERKLEKIKKIKRLIREVRFKLEKIVIDGKVDTEEKLDQGESRLHNLMLIQGKIDASMEELEHFLEKNLMPEKIQEEMENIQGGIKEEETIESSPNAQPPLPIDDINALLVLEDKFIELEKRYNKICKGLDINNASEAIKKKIETFLQMLKDLRWHDPDTQKSKLAALEKDLVFLEDKIGKGRIEPSKKDEGQPNADPPRGNSFSLFSMPSHPTRTLKIWSQNKPPLETSNGEFEDDGEPFQQGAAKRLKSWVEPKTPEKEEEQEQSAGGPSLG